MIKQGRERTNAEIIQGLDDLRRMISAGLPMTSRHEGLLDDAARRIGDQEERIDILTAELPGAGCAEGEGLLAGADHLAADALSLLKAQDAIEPVEMINDFYPIGDPLRTVGWKCGECGELIAGEDNYCPHCGKEIMWDD